MKNFRHIIMLVPVLACAMAVSVVHANEDYRELLFFPSAHAEYSANSEHEIAARPGLAADVFFAGSSNKFRLLAEVLAATDDLHLERAQLGIELSPKQFLWFGRFHSPLDYWNTHYNHAGFLQGSVHRPSIIEYDGHGGTLPTHASGVMLAGEKNRNGGVFAYDFLLGNGTELNDQGLGLIEQVNLRDSSNVFARASFRPDDTSLTQYGVFAGQTNFATRLAVIDDVKQFIGGVYAYKTWLNLRITTAGFFLNNTLTTGNTRSNSRFLAGYLHADYEFTSQWAGYARYEDSLGSRGDGYLALFPEFAIRRGVIGARFDINSHHAISIETAAVKMSDGLGHSVAIQWSAVYP